MCGFILIKYYSDISLQVLFLLSLSRAILSRGIAAYNQKGKK